MLLSEAMCGCGYEPQCMSLTSAATYYPYPYPSTNVSMLYVPQKHRNIEARRNICATPVIQGTLTASTPSQGGPIQTTNH
eukprot:scaffold176996_cov18-Prasinocladus_malaysianus.AAC.1